MANNKPNEDKKPDGVVNAQTAATDTPKVVDHSAPADNNIESIKTDGESDGKDRTDPNVADRQAGDPRVKVQRADGTVEERDATDEEAKDVADGDEKPPVGNPPAGDDDEQATQSSEGKDVEQTAVDARAAADEGEPTVKLENEHGKTVEVRVADVTKRRLFEHGFKKIKGEKYPDEVKDAHDAFATRNGATEAYTDHDMSDPMQSQSKADKERRGKATYESRQKSLKKATEPVTTSAVDGQTHDPKTNKPKSNSRLANALNKG